MGVGIGEDKQRNPQYHFSLQKYSHSLISAVPEMKLGERRLDQLLLIINTNRVLMCDGVESVIFAERI